MNPVTSMADGFREMGGSGSFYCDCLVNSPGKVHRQTFELRRSRWWVLSRAFRVYFTNRDGVISTVPLK